MVLLNFLHAVTDRPADMMESDSKFSSGEKPIVSRDSPVNK